MKYLYIFLISFTLVYLFYLITVILQKKRVDKFKNSNQVLFFIRRYNLDIKKININKFMQIISLSNSFIVAVSFTGTFLVNNFYLGLLIGLLVLIPTMLIIYDLIGKKLKRGEK